jgi:hydrogenase maturation protease
MARFLIIGYGNPLKSDDGVGWRAAEELSQQISSPEVKIVRAHQLTPELSEEAARAELVIFIDARGEGPPGEVGWQNIRVDAGSQKALLHSHDLSPAAILELANDLYGKAPLGYLLTVSGQHFEDGESLSKAVLSAIPTVIAQVRRIISMP